MAKKLLTIKYFSGGIADSEKEGIRGSFFFGDGLNIFDEPTNLTILPKTTKDSGTTVLDLIKWIVSGTPNSTRTYFYGDGGRIYDRTSAGVWTLLRTVAASDGQGMDLYNDFIYYTQRTQLGRYGPISGTPTFTDAWQTGLNSTTDTKFAPVKAFKEGFAVGNGNDLGWYDGTTWTQNKVVLPIGLEIRCLEVIDEYLMIGAWRGTSITDSEDGYVFLWDGTNSTFNSFVPIPEGGINAFINSRNRLLSIVGSSGFIYLGYKPFQKVKQLPKLPISRYAEVFPGAITNWRGIAHIGISGNTDSTALVQGVYQYGSKTDALPEVLNFGFPISTGVTTGTTLKIGAVKGLGDELFVGWRDGTDYGVDRVTLAANPFASANYESLIFDDGRPVRDKLALTLKAGHKALVSGESVRLDYSRNRASYTVGTANITVDSTETRIPLPVTSARFKDFQFRIRLATTVSTSPTVTSAGLHYDTLEEEDVI